MNFVLRWQPLLISNEHKNKIFFKESPIHVQTNQLQFMEFGFNQLKIS
jgi:hypothetical protein